MAITASFTGGCACGSIRYECSAEPIVTVNCHCQDCQRATGSAYSAELVVLKDALHLTKGQPTYYDRQSDSNTTIKRGFCAECVAGIDTKYRATLVRYLGVEFR
jgi:hypothetical protein